MNPNSNSTPASRTAPRHVLLLLGVQVASLSDPPIGVHSSARMRTNLSRLLTYARSVNPPPLIIHVRNTGDKGEPDEPGVPGWQLAFPALAHEPVIDKMKNNAFANTTLGDLIPINAEIVIAGMQTDYCIRATCSAALGRGNKITLIKNAHATFDGMAHSGAMPIPAQRIESETEEELEEAGVEVLGMSDLPSLFANR